MGIPGSGEAGVWVREVPELSGSDGDPEFADIGFSS
jgi:hypothetical protein